jgi:hypothetical protein
MLQPLCSGCRQPVDEQSSDCSYCRPLRSRAYVGRHVADRQVWCTSEQRYVAVSWVGAGQAFVCVCAKVHEVIECGDCGKAWGTAVNSFGELDRNGLRRCAGCRIPTDEQAAGPSPCTRCGRTARHPEGRVGRVLGRLRTRSRRKALECVECRAPVGWWQDRKRESGRKSISAASTAEPTVDPYDMEWAEGTTRWDRHGDEDQFVPGHPGAAGESAAA